MRRSDLLRASPPMFRSPTLDRLTRVHHFVPLAIFIPALVVLAALFWDSVALWKVPLLVLAGYVLWTLTEYWIHRVVFHFEPEQGIGARIHWMIHGVHHDHPNDPLRLVMPPAASVPFAILFIGVFMIAFGTGPGGLVGAGFMLGYLIYDMTHYLLHHHTPRSRLGKRLRELHMRHHFEDDTTGFGISAPYWDTVFGTVPTSRRRT